MEHLYHGLIINGSKGDHMAQVAGEGRDMQLTSTRIEGNTQIHFRLIQVLFVKKKKKKSISVQVIDMDDLPCIVLSRKTVLPGQPGTL